MATRCNIISLCGFPENPRDQNWRCFHVANEGSPRFPLVSSFIHSFRHFPSPSQYYRRKKWRTFFGLTLPAAVVFFPITYILGDVLTEVYGFHRARLTIWLGFFANLFMALVFLITVALPYPPYWTGQEAYKAVFGMTPRLVAASTVAYFAGSFLNSALLSKLKVATAGRWLWLKDHLFDPGGRRGRYGFIYCHRFWGDDPLNLLVNLILAQYLWKVTYEILVTPLTYPGGQVAQAPGEKGCF